jgi:hypothetical protein
MLPVLGEKNVHSVFKGKSEGKRSFGKHAHRWEDNVKIDLKEMGWRGGGWGLDSSGSR